MSSGSAISIPPSSVWRTRKYSSSQPILNSKPASDARSSWWRRIVRGQYGHSSPSTVASQANQAISGFHGSRVKLPTSGIAIRSGLSGVWPMSPAAKPANPAPSASSPSSCWDGISFALGFACMSTNCANRNSIPSSATARRTSSVVGR